MHEILQEDLPKDHFSTFNYEDCVGEARKVYLENQSLDEQIKMWKVVQEI